MHVSPWRKRVPWWAALAVAVVVLIAMSDVPAAHAATLSVCASGCPYTTIQDAIDAAQTGDTISVAPGTYTENLTIGGSATQLRLQKGLGGGLVAGFPGIPNFPAIPWFPNLGGEVIIDGGGAGRVLTVDSGRTVDLIDLTLRNGLQPLGGGINNGGTLRLTRVTVTDNQSGDFAGGIQNSGTLEARDSEVSSNRARHGAGISNQGAMTLTNVVVRDNTSTAVGGGGIYNSNTLTLRNVQVRGNHTEGIGGGIFAGGGNLTGTAVEISGNTAGGRGGGINIVFGAVTLTNSFIRNNTSADVGGGIFQGSNDVVSLTNTIITGNTGTRGGGVSLTANRSVTLQRAVVSWNTATDTGGGVFAETGATLIRPATTIIGNTPNNCAGAVNC